MRRVVARLALIFALAFAWVGAAEACGRTTPCIVDLGAYHVAAPDGNGPFPVVVHFHGANGNGAGVLRNRKLVETLTGRGYLVAAPNGLVRPGSTWTNWAVRDLRNPWRDEAAFARQVIDDLAKRFSIDRDRIIASGFSRGGSLVWDFACRDPGLFAAYAPVAGGFWRPHPRTCVGGPVRLYHEHGLADGVVPLEGRQVRSGAQQGDIFEGLQLWRAVNGCAGSKPDAFETKDGVSCRRWTRCAPASALELCLHVGGHGVPKGWSTRMLDWFEKLE